MNSWIFWLIVGIIGVVGGIVALLNPFVATITAERLAAWLFLIIGFVQLFAIFQEGSWGRRIWAVVLTVAFLWLGITLLFDPLQGILTLTIAVAILFLINGLAKIFFSFSASGSSYFWLILLSGAISVILAVMVFTNFPQSAAILLGILLAVELLSSGAAMIAFALFMRGNKDKLENAA